MVQAQEFSKYVLKHRTSIKMIIWLYHQTEYMKITVQIYCSKKYHVKDNKVSAQETFIYFAINFNISDMCKLLALGCNWGKCEMEVS